MRYLALVLATAACAQNRFTPGVQAFVVVDAPVIALEYGRVIDGTGSDPREDQTLVIEGGKVVKMGSFVSTPVPAGARVMDLCGLDGHPRPGRDARTSLLPFARRGALSLTPTST